MAKVWMKVTIAGETVVFTRLWRGWNGQGAAFPREWAAPAAGKIRDLLDLGVPREEAEALALVWLRERQRKALKHIR